LSNVLPDTSRLGSFVDTLTQAQAEIKTELPKRTPRWPIIPPETRPDLPPAPPATSRTRPALPSFLSQALSWFRSGGSRQGQLRLAETVSLGEKRFVAIIHVEGRKFLIGGGTSGVSLLTQLDETA
jgi:hypothetical protein